MPVSTLIQIIAAGTGIIGSLFFAIGVMRQSVNAMADLSGSYFGWNPHMVQLLAAQKADYLFGGGIIVLAFTLQLVSFLVPASALITLSSPTVMPWVVAGSTTIAFFILRVFAKRLAQRFAAAINARLKELREEHRRQLD